MAYKLSLKAQFEIKDVKKGPYDIYIYIYIYIHGSKIYKSLLKVSPLIWAQKACQKLSKKKKIMQIHKFGPIQSLNPPNRQIQPVQPMT